MPRRRRAAVIAAVACLAAFAGCMVGDDVEPFREPGDQTETRQVHRNADTGAVVVTYASYPLNPGAPPDGVRAALARAMGDAPCSAATFYWSERERALAWISAQLDARRRRGEEPRLVLAGHGLGATEASETAREVLFHDRDVRIVLLLTVDAVKTGRIGSAAGVTGNAIAHRIPGVNHNFTAYDAAPRPDGDRLLAHVNYYQAKSVYYHGTAMPFAENHPIDDWTGLLNHGNADDVSLSFLIADFRQALRPPSRPAPAAPPGQGEWR